MGMIRSKQYVENVTVNGILLGQPTIVKADGTPFSAGDSMDDLWFAWDDSRIPSGEVEIVSGDVVVTPDDDIIN